MSRRGVRTVEEFWARVDKSGECWAWTGTRHGSGYGVAHVNGVRGAHRVSWTLANGPIPPGAWVCHRCNNKVCVNPSHLYLGNALINTRDAIRDGLVRRQRGTQCHLAKLNDDAVRAMRIERAAGAKLQDLADKYGVSLHTTHWACTGKTWKHVV